MARDRELARIEQLLTSARGGRSGVLVLVGEPGVGKTWLCDRTAERADGFRILRTRGIEPEQHLGYAGLLDVISPLLPGALDALAPPRADALRGALRLGEATAQDPLAVAAACLDVLPAAADPAPALVIVDDAHWVDEPSLEALRFVARRLTVDPVVFLFAVRREGEGAFAGSRFEMLTVATLPDADAAGILEACTTSPVDPSVALRLVAATAGNPLALREAVAALSADQLAARAPLPEPLPTPAALQSSYAARAGELPVDTRQAVVVLAESEGAPEGVVRRAMSELALAPSAIEPAARAGLVTSDAAIPRFTHPLARAAVWHGAGLAERRLAHRALAAAWLEASDPERAAWHGAAATSGVDAASSLAMVSAARAARARGAMDTAAEAWRRAATLQPDADEGLRLRLEAALDLARAGRAAELLAHTDDVLAGQPPPLVGADFALLRGHALLWHGHVAEAAALFADAARRVQDADAGRAVTLLSGAAFAQAVDGDVDAAVRTARASVGMAESVAGSEQASARSTLGSLLILAGEGAEGYPLLPRSPPASGHGDDALARLPTLAPPFGQCACWMEDFDTARTELEGSVAQARTAGLLSALPHALSALAEFEIRVGDWAAARIHAEEALRLGDDINEQFHFAYVVLGQLDAITGRADAARGHIERVLTLGSYSPHGSLPTFGSAMAGLLELSLDRPELAAEHFGRTAALAERAGLKEPNVIQWTGDYIESQIRAGRLDDARRTLEEFERLAEHTGRRWALATAARYRALLAPPEDVDAGFAEAQGLVADVASPFEHARTQLCWGERLRRDGRRVDARRPLRDALKRFDGLGAAPWAERAARELRSTGVRADRGVRDATALTSSESQIAAHVSQGRTNKEVAAALFLSPKTVEFHLGHIYRKLGIHSRTQLAVAVIRSESPADPVA
jgi:DNA-binding CsgD family transcriptional regulator